MAKVNIINSFMNYVNRNKWHYAIDELGFDYEPDGNHERLLKYIDICLSSKNAKVPLDTKICQYVLSSAFRNLDELLESYVIKTNSIFDGVIGYRSPNNAIVTEHHFLLWVTNKKLTNTYTPYEVLQQLKFRLEAVTKHYSGTNTGYINRSFSLEVKETLQVVELIGGMLFGFK